MEVSATLDHGTDFVSPVGEDVSAASMFEVVDLFVMAAENGTAIGIDKDANGSYETAVTLNRGESYRVSGGVSKGARVTASEAFQVHLLTGDIGANPGANNVHDWGFSLVPEGNLTTVALVGWGPGSGDLSRNGSPVWVTAVKDTTIYVDYDGDLSGPFTDPEGNGYDVSCSLAALESRTVYDPGKDQTAMRLYTLDGVLITAAWGQDPATAAPGNPFLDLGTTVLPFPVPLIRKSSEIASGGDVNPPGLSIGDTLEYSITIGNNSIIVLGNVVVLDASPPSLLCVTNSTSRDGVAVADNPDPITAFPLDESGHVIPLIPRGGSTTFKYQAVVLASGSIQNGASTADATATNTVEVPPLADTDACGLEFTDSGGSNVSFYAENADIYVTLDDADANVNTTAVDTVDVVVENTVNADLEIVTLVETGADTGVFRRASPT